MMERIQVCIIDDEALARDRVRRMISAFEEFEIIGEYSGGHGVISEIKRKRPDLIFLDIQMPKLDGFQFLQSLGETFMPYIIFITAYDQYAVRAFEVNSLDYLLKPFNEKRFTKAILRAKEALRQKRTAKNHENILAALAEIRSGYTKRFAIKDQRTVRFVNVDQIDWIEARDKYLLLHQGNRSHIWRGSLVSMERSLNPEQFVRVHRSTIVNLNRVRELQPLFYGVYRVILNDNTALRVSRSCLNRLKKALLRG